MGFIITYLLTVVASISMEIKFGLQIYKDYADLGYIFNPKRNRELSDENYDYYGRNNALIHFIPFINVFNEITKVITYNKEFEDSLDGLLSQGAIRKMTEEELQEYKKKPTGRHALELANEMEQKNIDERRLNRFVIHHENGEDSTISYNFLGNKTNIIGATGPLYKESEETIKDILLSMSIAIYLNDPGVREHYGIKFTEADDNLSIVEMNDKILLSPQEDEYNEVVDSVKKFAKEANENEEREDVATKEVTINENGKQKVLTIQRRRQRK